MAYEDKSHLSPSKNFATSGTSKDYAHRRNDDESKPVKPKHNGTDHNEPKPPLLKENRSKRGYNSGTPCTSMAFTPSGKPAAIRTMKDTAKCKSSTPRVVSNPSKQPLFKDTRSKKEYNSGTPCISTAFTPLGKSPAIRTVKQKDLNLRNDNHEYNLPSFKSMHSDVKHQNTTKYHVSLQRSPVESAETPKNFIPSKAIDDSKSLPFKNTASVAVDQNMIKCYTHITKSSSVSAINAMDFVPRNAVHNSKLSRLRAASSDPLHQSRTKFYIPLKQSSAVNTEKLRCESLPEEILVKTHKDSNPLRFPATTSKTVRQSIFSKYCTPFRKSYPSEKTLENVKDFDFGSRKFQDPGSSHVPLNTPRGSTPVDLLRCIICIDRERDIVFQPCGHLVVCKNCAKDVESTCPMCRKRIKKKIKAYIT